MVRFASTFKKYHQFFLSAIFFGLFSFAVSIFAAPFTPGETLDPGCAPGAPTCIVHTNAIGNTITNATAGSLFFAGTAGILAQDNSNLFWDDTNNWLGVGTATPTTTLDIVGDGLNTAFPLTVSNTGYHAGIKLSSAAGNTDVRAMVSGQRSRGTIAAPTTLLADDTIFSLDAAPYIDGAYRNSGDIKFHVGASPGAGSYPMYIAFRTVNTGETTRTERLRISEAGNLGIGTTTPSYLLSVGKKTIGSVVFGGLLNDATIGGTYTGATTATYIVEIDAQGGDTYSVTKNGTSLSTNNTITLGADTISDGLTITFLADNGHDLGDSWTFTVTVTGDISSNSVYRTGNDFFATQEPDSFNLIIGKNASFGTSTAVNNTLLGISAGAALTTGGYNTLIGAQAGVTLTTGDSNVIVGNGAGAHLGIGTRNVAVGNSSGQTITSGSNNSFLGWSASAGGATVSNSVALGYQSAVYADSSIAIGAHATTTLANQMVIGGGATPIESVFIGSGVTSSTASSVAINASGGSGTDKVGGSFTIAGGRATGNALGGSVVFRTSNAVGTSTGITAQTLVDRFTIASTGDITIANADKGDGVAGPVLTVGRNTNATNTAAGSINFLAKAGTAGYVWQDAAGKLRIHTSAPSNANDTAGVVVGDQTSTRDTKQDIADYTDYSGALDMIANAPLHTFRYIKEVEGYGSDNPLAKTRIGFMADEVSPQFMAGNVIDQVSINGLLMASVRELNIKLQDINSLSVGSASFKDKLIAWLGDVNNGIEIITAKVFKADKVETRELCVGTTCVTEEQFMQVFQNQNSGSSAPAPAEEEDVSDVLVLEPDQSAESAPVAEEEVIASSDETAPDPAPEPVSESAPVE